MTADLSLAIVHHLLVFAVFVILALQLAYVRSGLDGSGVARLARLDAGYGAVSLAVLVVGFSRAAWGLRGWEYYAGYWVFWAKIGVFALVGLLSIMPTLRFRRWLTAAREPGYAVPAAEIAKIRKWLHAEAGLLFLIPILAAMLARGVFY